MVSLQSCKDDLSDLEEKVDFNNKQNFTSLKELWDYCRDGANSLDKRVQALQDFMDALNDLDEVEGRHSFVEAFKDLRTKVNDLADQVNALPLDELDNRLTNLESEVEAMIDRLDNMITSLIIQRAFGPAFGDFSLPIGIQSNMLFNWYGENIANLDEFPTTAAAGAEGIDFKCESPYGEAEIAEAFNKVDLGKIYLTANPVGHKFVGENLVLENSLGEQLPVVLEMNDTPDYLLTFGTRANNGFYEASVVVDKTDENQSALIETIDVTPDAAALKSAAKAAVKNPSVSTAANLVKAVYDQLTAKQIPAYALRYDWTAPIASKDANVKWTYDATQKKYVFTNVPAADDANATEGEETRTENDYAVLSKYELAVVTARPLSFIAFNSDEYKTDKKLPTGNLANFLDRLENKFDSKLDINATTDIDGYKVEIGNVTFAADDNGSLVATVHDMKVNGQAVTYPRLPGNIQAVGEGTFTVACQSVDSAVADVNEAIVEVLCYVAQKDDDAFRAEAKLKVDTVLLLMNNQINDIIADIQGSVKDAFSSITGSNYFELANRAFNLYNRFANKVNKFLANPNAALQVAALYDTADDLGFLSQNPNDRTIFTGEGNKIKIYLTTYTGEIVAPARLKYFACTNDDAVNTGDLGKVLKDGEKFVEITLPGKGKYDFVYQALDYSGYTSTKKFYIEVK